MSKDPTSVSQYPVNGEDALLITQTKRGNHKRSMGLRKQFGARLVTAFMKDFDVHGEQAIRDLREKSVKDYMNIAARLMPAQLEIEVNRHDGKPNEQLLKEFEDAYNSLPPYEQRIIRDTIRGRSARHIDGINQPRRTPYQRTTAAEAGILHPVPEAVGLSQRREAAQRAIANGGEPARKNNGRGRRDSDSSDGPVS